MARPTPPMGISRDLSLRPNRHPTEAVAGPACRGVRTDRLAYPSRLRGGRSRVRGRIRGVPALRDWLGGITRLLSWLQAVRTRLSRASISTPPIPRTGVAHGRRALPRFRTLLDLRRRGRPRRLHPAGKVSPRGAKASETHLRRLGELPPSPGRSVPMVHAGRRVPVVITHGRPGRSVPWHARMAPARLPVRHGTECLCIRGPGKQGGTDNARQEYMNSSPNECNRKVCAPWKRHRNTDRMKRQPHRARQRSRSQTKPHRSAPMTSSSHGSTQSPVRTDPGGASPYH